MSETEIEIYKECGHFNCYYGLKKVPKDLRPLVEKFLKEHGGQWHTFEEHPERGVSVFHYCIAVPRAKLPWDELEQRIGRTIIFVLGALYEGCDSEMTDDPDVWFS